MKFRNNFFQLVFVEFIKPLMEAATKNRMGLCIGLYMSRITGLVYNA